MFSLTWVNHLALSLLLKGLELFLNVDRDHAM
jgi:hypothetical protein